MSVCVAMRSAVLRPTELKLGMGRQDHKILKFYISY